MLRRPVGGTREKKREREKEREREREREREDRPATCRIRINLSYGRYTTAIVHRPYRVKVVRASKGSRAKRSAPLISQSLRKQSSSRPTPTPISFPSAAVLPGKIAYLHGAAFASKSLGGDVNNDRAACTYGFSSSCLARFLDLSFSPLPCTFNSSSPSLTYLFRLDTSLSLSLSLSPLILLHGTHRISERECAMAT